MASDLQQRDFTLNPEDNTRLASLCGPFDEHLRQIELRLGVEIDHRGHLFCAIGEEKATRTTEKLLRKLYASSSDEILNSSTLHLQLSQSNMDKLSAQTENTAQDTPQEVVIRVKRGVVKGRGPHQQRYLNAITHHDINFGIGPAGTGKTYLAVASAVEALATGRVQRLLLVRPAVEAGEKLGFLPGEMAQKVDPYLRPLHDALYEMLGFEKVSRLIERNVIEIAPLAYMRGRTLNDSYVILDEAQNTTIEQMKMFLTRIGFGSVAVITGDTSQVDLPGHVRSGLRHAVEVLHDVEDISFTFFTPRDVVRHRLVARIVRAYEAFEQKEEDNR